MAAAQGGGAWRKKPGDLLFSPTNGPSGRWELGAEGEGAQGTRGSEGRTGAFLQGKVRKVSQGK